MIITNEVLYYRKCASYFTYKRIYSSYVWPPVVEPSMSFRK